MPTATPAQHHDHAINDPPTRRGFALVEFMIVTIVTLLVAATLLIWLGDTRRNARLGQDLASLRHYGMGTMSYAADNSDLFWGFSWKVGNTPGADPDLTNAGSDLQARADQAVQILRNRANRPEITRITGWIPNILFSHLVFTDYMGSPLADHAAVSSGDQNRILWRNDPAGHDAGLYSPRAFAGETATNNDKRWPYSASWRLSIGFIDQGTSPTQRLKWGAHNSYFVPSGVDLRAPRMSDVRYPAQKAMLFDEFSRHHGERQAFYGYAEARVPVLAADGTVNVRTNGEGNIGWEPNSPTIRGESVSWYTFAMSLHPRNRWYPDPLNGQLTDPNITDRLMWTRGGILGRDFDGPEINTGQW
ncbi:MAG: type II secretion system protein [Phycisphaeraceae bacterium]|nr:type II secretion system protein [Phycisphaeraceae bacterium]MBX3367217.1 type II secretion system protein [Phycisphaeraceae bacterium]